MWNGEIDENAANESEMQEKQAEHWTDMRAKMRRFIGMQNMANVKKNFLFCVHRLLELGDGGDGRFLKQKMGTKIRQKEKEKSE